MEDLDDRIETLVSWMAEAERLIVFAGAGISTDSGLPGFRGPDGVWTRQEKGLPPKQAGLDWTKTSPNVAHYAVVDLQEMGKLDFVISQNIDDLHLSSGIRPELLAELHGNLALALLVGWVAPAPTGAEVPDGLSYQGLLVDGEGAPVDGILPVTLGVWDDAAPAGMLLYQESHASVDFADGVFQLVIGAGTATGSGVYPEFGAQVFEGADRYLEVAVDGEILAPRQKLTSVGYALQCQALELLSHLHE